MASVQLTWCLIGWATKKLAGGGHRVRMVAAASPSGAAFPPCVSVEERVALPVLVSA